MGTLQHVAISIVLQFIIYLSTGSSLASVAPFLIFLGREQSQTEYRYLSKHQKTRGEVKWLVFRSLGMWNIKSLLDWIVPLLTLTVISLLLQ